MNDVTDDTPSPIQPKRQRQSGRFVFAHLAFIIAVIPALFVLLTMMATHVGYISDDLGFKTLTLRVGPKLAMGAFAVAVLSLLITMFMNLKRYGLWALGAVIVSGAMTGGYLVYEQMLRRFPPIADVATDWDTPLTFSDKLIAERGAGAMRVEDLPRVPRDQSLEWGGRSVAQINAETCPGAQPIRGKHVSEDQVADVLTAQHYVVFGRAPWRVEGTYQDNFFGFKSDVVVRIDPDRIDLRSTSRYDVPDLGDNCRRLTALIAKIKALPDTEDGPPAASAASNSAADSAEASESAFPTAKGDDGGDE